MKEREFSVTKLGYKRYLKAAPRKELNTAKIKNEMLCSLRAIQGHSDRIPVESEFVGYVFIPRNRNRYIFHTGLSWNFQSILEKELILGGKEKIKPVRQSFLLQRILLNMTRRKKSLTVYWIRLSKAQDQELEF